MLLEALLGEAAGSHSQKRVTGFAIDNRKVADGSGGKCGAVAEGGDAQ